MDGLRSKRLIKYREIVHGIPNKYSSLQRVLLCCNGQRILIIVVFHNWENTNYV